jgi:hypothetical protein
MTDQHEPVELPADLLADLDAGLLDPTRAAEVRAAAARDPHAAAVLAALAATRTDLGELADPPVPAQYAARWDAALAAEADAPPPAPAEHRDGADNARSEPLAGVPERSDPDIPRPAASPSGAPRRLGASPARRHRIPFSRRRVRPALVAAAVLAAAVVWGAVGAPREADPPLSLDGVDLARAGLAVRGDFDVGDLADPARRAGCLRAVAPPGVPPDALLLGGRDLVVAGRDGVLLLLAGGGPGRLHVVVVEPGCGPEGGVLLGIRAIGG